MATDPIQRGGIALTVFLAIAGVGLIVASFASDHWIDSNPKMDSSGTRNSSSYGKITFGLFSGFRSLNFNFGDRNSNPKIECDSSENVCAFIGNLFQESLDDLIAAMNQSSPNGERKSMEEVGLFDFRLYVATLVFLCLGIVWGLVTIGFSIFNIFGRPIETITGRSGLFLWNGLALIFTVTAIAIFLGMFFSQLKENILTPKELKSFTSKGHTDLDYSFFFVVGGAGAFLLNIFVLALATNRLSCGYGSSAEKEVDNGMILY